MLEVKADVETNLTSAIKFKEQVLFYVNLFQNQIEIKHLFSFIVNYCYAGIFNFL